jgi:hypothetical protein
MTLCRVCGRAFDPNGFQVVVPGLGQGFDRVECAEIALARGVAPAAPPAAPLPAVVKPFPAPALGAAAAPVATVLDRRPFLLGANVALLAAGTAVTVYLWLRVFGADPSSSLSLPAESGTPAWERATVPAAIDTTPEGATRPEREAVPARRTPRAVAPATSEAPAPDPTRSSTPAPVLVSNPTPPAPPVGGGGDGGGGGGGSTGGGGGSGGGGGGGGGTAPPQPQPNPEPTPAPPPPAPPVTEEPRGTRGGPHGKGGQGKGNGPPAWVPGPPPWSPGPPPWAGGPPHSDDGPPFGKAKGHDKQHEKDHDHGHESGNGKKKGHGKHH